jgi:hypothetical protein
MNATDEKTDVVEDIEIEVPTTASFETMPPGTYNAKLVGLKVVPKPDWKLKGEEGEDREQWEWTFMVTDGDYAGSRLKDFTNRTWHERAKAHKHAAALLGVPTLPVGVGMSTGQLAGKTCQLWVTEVESKKNPGEFRNYIDKVTPTPTPRMRPQRKQEQRVQLDGYPTDEGGDEIEF